MCEQQYQAEVMDELKMLCYNDSKKGSVCQEVFSALERLQSSSENQNDGYENFALQVD